MKTFDETVQTHRLTYKFVAVDRATPVLTHIATVATETLDKYEMGRR